MPAATIKNPKFQSGVEPPHSQSRKEVFETLDRQYREQNKPEIWFLPLNKPIAPHLDELLGPVPGKDK